MRSFSQMNMAQVNFKNLIIKGKIRILFLFLVLAYFCAYFAHIPKYTSYSDVYIYVCRALNEKPIIDYPFLDEPTLSLQQLKPLPNYHLAHTILLWLVYRAIPTNFKESIYPSGILSAIIGALAVGMTFLICIKMGFNRYQAFLISAAFGIIPTTFYYSTIGEVHIIGLFSILLFLYLFLYNRIFYSCLGFLFANLLSPINGLGYSFYFIISQKKETIKYAMFIGAGAVLLYFIIFYSIARIDYISGIFDPKQDYLRGSDYDLYLFARSMYHWIRLFLLNLGPFIVYLIQGMRVLSKTNRFLMRGIFFVILAYVIPAGIMPVFLGENGSFFLPAFWALCIPIGVGISEARKGKKYAVLAFVALYAFTRIFWMEPYNRMGKDLVNAGLYLRKIQVKEDRIMGSWNAAIGVVVGKYGFDLKKINAKYIEYEKVGDEQLLESGVDSILFIEEKVKRAEWKEKVYKYLRKKPKKDQKLFNRRIRHGKVKKLLETEYIYIYRWKKKGNIE